MLWVLLCVIRCLVGVEMEWFGLVVAVFIFAAGMAGVCGCYGVVPVIVGIEVFTSLEFGLWGQVVVW